MSIEEKNTFSKRIDSVYYEYTLDDPDFNDSVKIYSIVEAMFYDDSYMDKIKKCDDKLLSKQVDGYMANVFEFYYDIMAFAVIAGKLDAVKYLFNTGKFNVDKTYKCCMDNYTNLLGLSVQGKQHEITEYLLTLNPDLSLTDVFGVKLYKP